MRDLQASLNDHPMALLRGIAELHGVALPTNLRADAAAQLSARLVEPGALAAALATCSAEARAAWDALAAAGGRMKSAAFTRAAGQIRPLGPGRLERELPWRQPAGPAEELWYRGLIFRTFADLGDGPLEYIYVPDELLPPQPSRPAVAEVLPFAPPAHPPACSEQAFNALAVDTCQVLASLRLMPARLDRAGQLNPTDVDGLREGLCIPNSVRLALLVALARRPGWLVSDRGRLTLNTPALTPWLRGTHWEQMKALFQGWRESGEESPDVPGWNDLRHVPSLKAEGDWRNDPTIARHAILEVLSRLPGDAWYGISDFVAWMKAVQPDFQRLDSSYDGWYLRDAETGSFLSGFESWDQVEGRLIRFLITGPLFWLGGLALGGPEVGQYDAFRLTPMGLAWLAGRMPAELPRPARLTLQEDFTISAPLWLPLLDRFRLLRFSEPIADERPPGGMTRHRISRRSLARAREDGVKAEAVLTFLRHATGGHVPARVVAGLQRWDQHSGTVRVSRGAVLRVDEASILATLRADPVLAPLLGDLLSAQAVLVSEGNLPKVLAALHELGYKTKPEA